MSATSHHPMNDDRVLPAAALTSPLIDIRSVAETLGVTPRHIQRLGGGTPYPVPEDRALRSLRSSRTRRMAGPTTAGRSASRSPRQNSALEF
jgi:hypothetical protein